MQNGPVVSTSFTLPQSLLSAGENSSSLLCSRIGKEHVLLILGWKFTSFGEVWLVGDLIKWTSRSYSYRFRAVWNRYDLFSALEYLWQQEMAVRTIAWSFSQPLWRPKWLDGLEGASNRDLSVEARESVGMFRNWFAFCVVLHDKRVFFWFATRRRKHTVVDIISKNLPGVNIRKCGSWAWWRW